MAGYGNRPGRGSGGTLAASPPRSSIIRSQGIPVMPGSERHMRRIDADMDRSLRNIGDMLASIRRTERAIWQSDREGHKLAMSPSAVDRLLASRSGMTRGARRAIQRRLERALTVANGRNPGTGWKALSRYRAELDRLPRYASRVQPFGRGDKAARIAQQSRQRSEARWKLDLDDALRSDIRRGL